MKQVIVRKGVALTKQPPQDVADSAMLEGVASLHSQ